MRRGIALAAFLIAAVLSAVAVTRGRTAPTPDDRLQGAFRKPAVSGWTFVHVQGTPSQIGYQHGYLLSAEIADLENPVCSIYPGFIVARPRGSEVMIAYGPAEYRWNIGTDYLTPIAKLTENRPALLRTLSRMHDEGDKPVRIRRDE